VVRGRLSRAVVACAVAALAAACGTSVLDTGEVGTEIAARIEEQTGADVESVDCPGDVEAKAGATFTCTVTATDGTSLAIDVEQTNDDGALSFQAPILHTTEAEQVIAADIGGGTTVDCPELVIVQAGATFDCALGGGGSGTVTVTLKDDNGNFDYEVNS
jgi:hypothetical protein